MRFVIRRLLACLSRAPMLAALALVCAFAPGASAVGGNPKAHRSSSVLLGNGMAVDVSNTPSPLATSLVFSGADSLRGTRHVLRETLAREPFAADGPEPDAGPTRRAALEVAAEGLFDIFGFEVGGEKAALASSAPTRRTNWTRKLLGLTACPLHPHSQRPHRSTLCASSSILCFPSMTN